MNRSSGFNPLAWLKLGGLLSFLLPLLVIGCNDYPLQALIPKPLPILDDIVSQNGDTKVDILFVTDNSGSMKEEQEKLSRNFKSFITKLLQADVNDFQLGIVTTDMDKTFNPDGWGRLQGSPKIIQYPQLTGEEVINAFVKNVNVGTGGSGFEKPLAAVQAALSKPFIDDPKANQGFLRSGALLAIIFLGDEDDCSHKDTLDENKLSDSCYVPSSEVLLDSNGKPLPNNERGQMEKLTPVKEFIDFIKKLKRTVIVSGIIGDPKIFKAPNSTEIIDPQGGCQKDIECGGTGGRCGFLTPTTRRCGGCNSKDANAGPSHRLYEVIQAFSVNPEQQWYSICGDDKGFEEALLRFAAAIIDRLNAIPLTTTPADPSKLLVRIRQPDGKVEEVKRAAATGQTCDPNAKGCPGDQECGQDFQTKTDQCHGDGWVYIPGVQPKLKLSGTAKKQAQLGAKITVSYVAK